MPVTYGRLKIIFIRKNKDSFSQKTTKQQTKTSAFGKIVQKVE